MCFVSKKLKKPHIFSAVVRFLRRYGKEFFLEWDRLKYCTTMWCPILRSSIKGKKERGIKHLIWIAVVWNLRSARNKVLFRGEVVNMKICMSVIYTAWGWFVARKG